MSSDFCTSPWHDAEVGILTKNPVPDDFTGTRIGVCNLCEAICGIQLTIESGEVTSIKGNPADPLSRGYICPKGVSMADVYTDPDRLTRPVKRVSTGSTTTDPNSTTTDALTTTGGGTGDEDEWEEIGWDEAFDLVADRLADTVEKHGADAVGIYLGNPSVHSLGNATHGVTMFKTLKTRNRFSASTVDQIPHQFVGWQLYGHQLLLPVPDIDRTSYFLVFGANPMASNGSLMTVPDFPNRLRELKKRDGQMVVFDPRRTETAKVATAHHFVRPGTDASVLLAMLHVILQEGLTDLPPYVDHLDALTEAVADFTPERAEAVSGVAAETIRQVARDFAAADGAAAYGRIGVSTHGFGSVCQWAIQCLNIITGNFDREGGVLFPEPAIDTVGRRIASPGHFDAWRSRVRGLPEFAGELPVAAFREEIETGGEGQIRAVFTSAGNPVLSTPDGAGLSRALEGLDFMASVDFYINETTRHADVILPPTSALERDQYDLVFHGLAVRNTARFTPAVFGKSDDQRHDWEIFSALAARLSDRLAPKRSLQQKAMARMRMGLSPAVLIAGLLATGRKTTMLQLRAHPEGVDLGPLKPTMPARLQTKNQRIDLTPPLLVGDLERLRTSLADGASSDPDDLLLIGRRHKQDCNSWMHNTARLTRGKPRHHLLMHPDDLATRGITDGSRVTVTSRVGRVEVEVTGEPDLMPGVVSLPHGYGPRVSAPRLSHATTVQGVSINDLTDPELLDISGNSALTGVPVKVAEA